MTMEHEILTPQLVELIVGATAIVGAILIVAGVLLAKAFGFIHFGRKEKQPELLTYKLCPSHKDLLKGQESLAENHKDLAEQVETIKINQVRNMEKHEDHQKSFTSGEKMMKKLGCDIKNLSIGIAVLLDRQPERTKKIEGVNLDVGSLIKALTYSQDDSQ